MHSPSSGPFTTLLMLVPLIVVPLLAIFGIPQFMPVIASPSSEEDDSGFAPNAVLGVGRSTRHTADEMLASASSRLNPDQKMAESFAANAGQSQANPFREFEQPSLDNPLKQQPEATWVPPLISMAGWELDSKQSSEARPANRDRGRPHDSAFLSLDDFSRERKLARKRNKRDPAFIKPETPLTWQSAVRWLNELGIHHYQLEPGQHENEFYFSCSFSPGNNSRITQRFEAEAAEPLRAVEKVLVQIENWQKHQ